MTRYVDWAVKNLSATVTISAGNASNCAANDLQGQLPGTRGARSPSARSMMAPAGSGRRCDGRLLASTRTRPSSAGMEKPEVVAVGVGRVTTDASGFSAVDRHQLRRTLVVAGQVANCCLDGPARRLWPETNKAAVLVSAFHDIEGGLANRSRDGVGAIVMKTTATTPTGSVGSSIHSGNAAAGSFPKNYTIPLTAGQVARAATTWDANSSRCGPSTLGADIDLCVFRNDTGAQVACSASMQNAVGARRVHRTSHRLVHDQSEPVQFRDGSGRERSSARRGRHVCYRPSAPASCPSPRPVGRTPTSAPPTAPRTSMLTQDGHQSSPARASVPAGLGDDSRTSR